MASSFGYFVVDRENEKILCEAFRLLRPGGVLLLDLPNREYVLKHFASQSWHEADGEVIVCRQRQLDGDILYSREMVMSKLEGLIREANYCTYLYSPDRITAMLKSVGFSSVATQKDSASYRREGDYGLMTNRMIVIAGKK
jgi:D-alanine-D-alanine ligase